MKKFILLTFVLSFCLVSFSQNKGDNTIILHDSTLQLDNIRKLWLLEGFVIDKNTADYLTTELKQKGWYSMKFSALKEADSIILKAWVQTDITLSGLRSSGLIVADYKGMKGSANRETFLYLLGLAKKLTTFVNTTKQ